MAEPSLAAAFDDLRGEVGDFLGYGFGVAKGDTTWTTAQERTINTRVKTGLRMVYYCGYDWSFLKPVATLTLLSGQRTIPLPDDFGGLEGQITVSVSGSSGFYPIPVVGDVRPKFALNSNLTGIPICAAIDPLKGTTASQGQRSQLYVFPQADKDYTLQLAYYLNPDALSGAFPYVYGGAQHAQTFLAACKAAAERDGDDIANGPQMQEFARLLEVSKNLDRRNKPQVLGYNADRSDGRDVEWNRRLTNTPSVTYSGISYP